MDCDALIDVMACCWAVFHLQLFTTTPQKINVFAEAVKTVDATKAVGKPHTLWVEFAKLYESNGALSQARDIFKMVGCGFGLSPVHHIRVMRIA